MKRWILYAAIVMLLLFLAPVEKTDIGDLVPVELLLVSASETGIRLETDTGDWGTGKDLEEALKDLEATAAGIIFLETADYLIVTEETSSLLPQLSQVLRPATEVCLGIHPDGKAGEFLRAHKPGVTLNQIRTGEVALPILVRTGERYHFESKGNQ